MCLAVPGKVIRKAGDEAEVDLQGNRLSVSTLLAPEVREGDWVLIHAGFVIQTLDEQSAKETFALLSELETT